MPLVSVVIPFYNEHENVPLLAQKVFEALDAYDYECLFVNDGSTDGTREQIDALVRTNPRVRPVHMDGNQGQSAAILAGMQRAKGDYILTIDGDLQNDPADFPKLIELLSDYDLVCGYRAKRNDTWVRRVSSRVANKVRGAILKDGIRDTGCGTKGFRRECVPHLVAFNGAHRFFAAVLRGAGFSIVETPVQHHERQHGESKYGINNRLWRGIYDLVGVTWLLKRQLAVRVEDE